MSKQRGNPNWGKPEHIAIVPTSSTFDSMVKALGLTPDTYIDSVELKRWVSENKDNKYVPTELLDAWGFAVNSEAE
jgi:hypothetical protein